MDKLFVTVTIKSWLVPLFIDVRFNLRIEIINSVTIIFSSNFLTILFIIAKKNIVTQLSYNYKVSF